IRHEFADGVQDRLRQIHEDHAPASLTLRADPLHEALVLAAERAIALFGLAGSRDLLERTNEELGDHAREERVVAIVLDDAHELHHRIATAHRLFGRFEARRIHAVCPAHEGFQLVELHAEAVSSDVRDELGAGRVRRIVEVSSGRAASLEGSPILLALERGSVVVEKPAQARRIREAVVEDGVVVAIEDSGVRPLLALTVAARPVLELCPGPVDGTHETGENNGTGQAVEAVPVRGDHESHVGALTTWWGRARKGGAAFPPGSVLPTFRTIVPQPDGASHRWAAESPCCPRCFPATGFRLASVISLIHPPSSMCAASCRAVPQRPSWVRGARPRTGLDSHARSHAPSRGQG